MKNTWIKILFVYVLHLLSFAIDYTFLYQNVPLNGLWDWINPLYSIQFIVIGIVCCVIICKQKIKEFSDNVLVTESFAVIVVNVLFILAVAIIGSSIGNYKIRWIGVLYNFVYCFIFVGITEEWIYRGFIVTQLNKVFRKEITIVLASAAMFSLMHLPSFLLHASNITFETIGYRLLIPFLMGISYALVFLWKKNILTLIVMHGTYDLIEEIAFDKWYYIAYGIYWVMTIAYVVYCDRTRRRENVELLDVCVKVE